MSTKIHIAFVSIVGLHKIYGNWRQRLTEGAILYMCTQDVRGNTDTNP